MTTLSMAALLLAAAPAAMGRLDPKAFCEDKADGSYADVSSDCTKYVVCSRRPCPNACGGRRAGQSEVGWTTCAPGARRTLSMLLLLLFGGKGIYNKWC